MAIWEILNYIHGHLNYMWENHGTNYDGADYRRVLSHRFIRIKVGILKMIETYY